MYFVYVLRSKTDGEFYTRFTNNLDRRIEEHNKGLQVSTKSRLPLELVYYEYCSNKIDALTREKYLKSGVGKKFIRNRLSNYLEEKVN